MELTSTVLPFLEKLTNLTDLDLSGNYMTDDDKLVLLVEKLTKLRKLGLAHTDVADVGLQRLENFPMLHVSTKHRDDLGKYFDRILNYELQGTIEADT